MSVPADGRTRSFTQDVLPALAMAALLFLFALAIGNATFDGDESHVRTIAIQGDAAQGDAADSNAVVRLPGGGGEIATTLRLSPPDSGDADAHWLLWVPRDPLDAVWVDGVAGKTPSRDFFRPSPDEGVLPSGFIFPIATADVQPLEVVLHAQSQLTLAVRPQLLREDAVSLRSQRNVALATMVYTGVFALALLAVGLFTAARERVFLSLFGCALSGLLLLSAFNGHLYTLPVVGLLGWWREQGLWGLAWLFQAALLRLLGDMTRLRGEEPRLARAVRIAAVSMLALAVVPLVRVPLGAVSVWLLALSMVVTTALGTALLLRAMRRRPLLALPAVLLPLTLVAVQVRVAMAEGWLRDVPWTRYGFQLALFALLCALGFALIKRVGDYRSERDHDRKARLDSERRIAAETARTSLTAMLQSRLREQAGSDVQWTAFRLLLEHVMPQVPADLGVVIAHGFHRQDVLVVNPMPRKALAEASVAPRLMSIKYQAMSGRVHQQGFITGDRRGNELLLPIPADVQGWGALLLQREGGEPFDVEEIALATEFLRLTKLHIDETVATHALRRTAEIDALTGTLNRRSIDQWLTRHFMEEAGQAPLALLFVDIDHFKQVNDLYGHACGDQCLRSVAQALRGALGQRDLLGRYGGEEFVAVLPDCTPADARVVAERLRTAVESRAIEWQGQSHRLTVSIGVGSRANSERTAAALLDRADQALYTAKRGGRNRIEVGTP